jgi:hypothetical protein
LHFLYVRSSCILLPKDYVRLTRSGTSSRLRRLSNIYKHTPCVNIIYPRNLGSIQGLIMNSIQINKHRCNRLLQSISKHPNPRRPQIQSPASG